MFLSKYLDEFYYNLLLDNYEMNYLNSLDEDNFLLIYNLFKEFNFYFINDIILNYLEIFEMDYNIVLKKIKKLKDSLGNNFIYIIGSNMNYLENFLEE